MKFDKIILLGAAILAASPLPLEAKSRKGKGDVTVAVFSLNDFHGGFVRNDYKNIPGAPAVWQALDSLKSVYPYNVTVAAGDNFGGSFFYAATKGVLLPVFYNDLGIRLSALGNHEFDDGQKALAQKWQGAPLRPAGWNLSYVCANVRNASGEIPAFAQPFASAEIPIGKGKSVKVGFVGLLASSTPSQASKSKIAGLTFDGRYTAVLDSVKRLPGYSSTVGNADLRLLLTHIGSRMSDGQPEWDDKDAANLQLLDDPTWNGILSSHSHQPVCGTINACHYPIVQGKWHGEYISVLKATINLKKRKVKKVEVELCPVNPNAALGAPQRRLQSQIDSLLTHTKRRVGHRSACSSPRHRRPWNTTVTISISKPLLGPSSAALMPKPIAVPPLCPTAPSSSVQAILVASVPASPRAPSVCSTWERCCPSPIPCVPSV